MDDTEHTDRLHQKWWNLLRLESLRDMLKHESRFVIQEPYKSLVDSAVHAVRERLTLIVPVNTVLFRARINGAKFGDRDEGKTPFSLEEMGPPPHQLAKPGRINPEGIPYLYCAGDPDTAGAELRPWKGAFLTVAEVSIVRDIAIADLTSGCKVEEWGFFLDELSQSYSTQWPSELQLNYLISQYFSEYFKAVGLRGVKYRSSFNNGGDNYALFYGEDYNIVRTYCTEAIYVGFFFSERQTS